MNEMRARTKTTASGQPSRLRVDFIPVENHISTQFTRLENERLWPKVWQTACREEDLPEVGSLKTRQEIT
jgi:hypothetical protein